MTTHLLTLADLSKEEFEAFFKRAATLKEKQRQGTVEPLQAGKENTRYFSVRYRADNPTHDQDSLFLPLLPLVF